MIIFTKPKFKINVFYSNFNTNDTQFYTVLICAHFGADGRSEDDRNYRSNEPKAKSGRHY
jgi:hypothetical protein